MSLAQQPHAFLKGCIVALPTIWICIYNITYIYIYIYPPTPSNQIVLAQNDFLHSNPENARRPSRDCAEARSPLCRGHAPDRAASWGSKRPHKHKDPTKHNFWHHLILGLRTRMSDPHVYAVSWAPNYQSHHGSYPLRAQHNQAPRL